MLSLIKITDYALIEECELEFSNNFNVVTGESGAGKSILMSAAAFLLGGRTDRSVIRTGCTRATVTGCFSVPENLRTKTAAILDEAGIPFDMATGELSLRRVITQSATRNFINDTPAGAALVSEIGSILIDLHGANEHLSLTSPTRQLELLDHYLALDKYRTQCAEAYAELKELQCQKEAFSSNLPTAAEMEHLESTIAEIDAVSPEEGEEEQLISKQKTGSNAKEIIDTANQLANLLNEGENSISDLLGTVYHKLDMLSSIDSNLASHLAAECSDIQYRVAELARNTAAIAEKVDINPEELAAAENRLAELFRLKRRYAPDIGMILDIRSKAAEKLDSGRNAEAKLAEFEQQEKRLTEKLQQACRTLSEQRRKNSKKFTDAVAEKLQAVGFFKSEIHADFTDTALSPSGMDKIELLFSANPGEAPAPLRKIASSGELSRLMLALKTVLTDSDETPTVIFDEIDMNIGGETANRVGEELKALGKKHQILCISHLAQVAAKADTHFQVSKQVSDGRTVSKAIRLKNPEQELARMLGGGNAALEHAKTLINGISER